MEDSSEQQAHTEIYIPNKEHFFVFQNPYFRQQSNFHFGNTLCSTKIAIFILLKLDFQPNLIENGVFME